MFIVDDKQIYSKLQEAEEEMDNTNERYSLEEVIKSMNDIINKVTTSQSSHYYLFSLFRY